MKTFITILMLVSSLSIFSADNAKVEKALQQVTEAQSLLTAAQNNLYDALQAEAGGVIGSSVKTIYAWSHECKSQLDTISSVLGIGQIRSVYDTQKAAREEVRILCSTRFAKQGCRYVEANVLYNFVWKADRCTISAEYHF